MPDKITFIIFVLTSMIFLLTILILIESGYINENFTNLPSKALLALTTTNIVKEQELASNIIQTAKAEIKEAQGDLDRATVNEATASQELTRATNELASRNKNFAEIQAAINKMFPPGAVDAMVRQ